MTAHVWDNFIGPLARVFQDPPGNDAEAFFEDLAGELAFATSSQLAEAAATIKRQRTARGFPTLAECVAAVNQTPSARRTDRELTAASQFSDDPWSPQSMFFADNLLRRQSVARQAAEEGWLYGLWDFARRNRRMPDEREMRKVRDRGHQAKARIEECRAVVAEPAKEPQGKVGTFQPLGGSLDFKGSHDLIAEAYEAAERRAVQRVFPRLATEAAE